MNQMMTRRSLIIGGIQGGLGLTLIGRLYFLQVLNKEHYQFLSDKNRIQYLDLLPTRGKIFDRTGTLIAGNQTTYRSLINLENKKEIQTLLKFLKSLIHMDDQTLDRINKQLKKRLPGHILLLKEGLSWQELSILELYSPDLPGLIIEKNQTRFYPYSNPVSHITGYVAAASEKDIEKNPQLALLGLKVGKSGLEKTQDQSLQGKSGSKKIEIDATQKIVRTLDIVPSTNGKDLQLTLDLNLQQAVRKILQDHLSSAAVVLDINTGAVLAVDSYPSFNSNIFINGLGKEDWKTLINNPHKPMINKVINGQYSPGSTFKMIVALAGLSSGVIHPDTCFQCNGHYNFYDHRFHCWNWKTGGHGNISLQDAIKQSCDVYFYQLSLLIGAKTIAKVARDFGLGSVTGIELPSEKSGLIPDPDWKKEFKKKSWTAGETLNLSIGQGMILTTPLQLAKMTAMLANGCHLIHPHLIKQPQNNVLTRLSYSETHQNLIKKSMWEVVNHPLGTAYRSRIIQNDFEMAGKTGSTQVARISLKEREQNTLNDRPYHLKEHALFVGYAPAYRPRFAVAVVVEHGGSGAKTAAPLGRDILRSAQQFIP